MSKQLRLDVAQLTDVGRRRPHNEDNMAYVIPKDPLVMARKGALFIVADGMGGHAAGEVASEIAVDTVSNVYYQDDSEDIAISLLHAIKRANALIHQRAAENMLRSGMGTTCVAAVLRGNAAYIANVGDSRAYLVRHGQVRQVSQDHSWVAEQVRAGLLTEDQARSHAQRNVITRCLGTQADVDVDVFSEQLEEADSLVLCTDGLSGLVADDDLRSIVDQYVPQESVYHLVERANENGGSDNITAIVVRVQEVGWEPPNGARTLRLGGREGSGDTTATLVIPGAPAGIPLRADDGRHPSAPLRLISGPLISHELPTASQPAVPMRARKRRRLLYPTLALFVLVVVALVSGGIYYWLHLSTVDIDASLKNVTSLVSRAKTEVSAHKSVAAFQDLAQAQRLLSRVQTSPLTDTQNKSLSNVQQDFVLTVKSAIRIYNQQYAITALPCSNVAIPSNVINAGSTNTQANSLARILDATGKAFFFVMGEDHHLYQLDTGFSMVNQVKALDGASVLKITSDGVRLLALTSSPMQGSTTLNYSLSLLTLDKNGVLQETNKANIDPILMQGGQVPSLLTAWGADVYVVLTSQTAPNSPTILNYNADKLSQSVTRTAISITTPLVSIAAFPGHLLFLATSNGLVQSLVFNGNSQTSTPTPVVVQDVIATPLPVSGNDFTTATAVPIPTPVSTAQPTTLTLTQSPLLATGSSNGVLHLYIMDNNRILDLKAVQGIATPGITTTVTPTATEGAGNGGAVTTPTAASQVKLGLLGQYTSLRFFTSVKSIVADPDARVSQLYLLNLSSQNAAVRSLVTVDVNQKLVCSV